MDIIQHGLSLSRERSHLITGVQDVYYEVQDMKRAVAFDRDVPGLRATDESEDWSAFNVGGLRVGLDSTEGRPTPKRAILTPKTNDIPGRCEAPS
jgi:hypothetical protein